MNSSIIRPVGFHGRGSQVEHFLPLGLTFNGSTSHFYRFAGTGLSDHNFMMFSVWMIVDAHKNYNAIFSGHDNLSSTLKLAIYLDSAGRVKMRHVTPGTTTVKIDVTSVTGIPAATVGNLLISLNTSDLGDSQIYWNDTDLGITPATFTSGNNDYTHGTWEWGTTNRGTSDNMFDGLMAEQWFLPGWKLDFTVLANRRKFRTVYGYPEYLGTDGSIPRGVQPAYFISNAPQYDGFSGSRGYAGGFNLVDVTTGVSFL